MEIKGHLICKNCKSIGKLRNNGAVKDTLRIKCGNCEKTLSMKEILKFYEGRKEHFESCIKGVFLVPPI